MESVLGRYRNLIILVGVLFLQVLGLAVQVKRSVDSEHTRLIRIWVVDAITPFERVIVRAQDGAGNLWRNYFFLRGVRAENRQLKEQIEQMRLQQVRLNEDAAQAHRLQSLLAFKEQVVMKTVPAQVIGSSGSDLSRSIYIDKGSNQGIAPDMPVITAAGIVGKVLRTYPSTSLVLMINDQSSGVGVLLEKTRLQGVLRGTADGELVLERIMSDEQVLPGETVLSSGGDQIFPKGFPVGTVMKVSPGKELFLNIRVHAAADLSRLEEVLVLTEKQERQIVAEDVGKVRAADILAQRLPSVPDKPATAPATGKSLGIGAPGAKLAAESGAAKPGASDPQKSVAGAGSAPKSAERPAPRLAPASTSAETPVVKSPNTGAGNGSAEPGAGTASRPKPASSPVKNSEPAAVPPNSAIPQSNPQPAIEDHPTEDHPN